jgi:hypothetical protein
LIGLRISASSSLSEKFEVSRRRDTLSWSHHQELAAAPKNKGAEGKGVRAPEGSALDPTPTLQGGQIVVTLDRCRVCIECSPLNRHIAERGRAVALPLSRSCDRAAKPSYLSLPCSAAALPWLG